MYIRLETLAMLVLIVLAFAAGIYIIITLRNINDILKYVKQFLREHNDEIDKSVKLLPETIKNANDLTVSVKKQVDDIGSTVNALGTGIYETVASLQDKTETGMGFFKSFSEIARLIMDIYHSFKDK